MIKTGFNKQVAQRKIKGKELYDLGNIMLFRENIYIVKSASDESTFYEVNREIERCNCPDNEQRYKSFKCKHIYSVMYFLNETIPDQEQEDEIERQKIKIEVNNIEYEI